MTSVLPNQAVLLIFRNSLNISHELLIESKYESDTHSKSFDNRHEACIETKENRRQGRTSFSYLKSQYAIWPGRKKPTITSRKFRTKPSQVSAIGFLHIRSTLSQGLAEMFLLSLMTGILGKLLLLFFDDC
jgi:hypothetical protein